ncbi:putative serine/threonine protein kinase [Blattamonas nauphoetae]|uniref:Serine/threonine protein kinase n=1 Tax=Blattamonas nauphoetae TaxID=2049346 RepID=A0ABQ9Y5V3_9EUKA|nr:putative serine/threonine protein kinase [Blattamonas nauphoetae]
MEVSTYNIYPSLLNNPLINKSSVTPKQSKTAQYPILGKESIDRAVSMNEGRQTAFSGKQADTDSGIISSQPLQINQNIPANNRLNRLLVIFHQIFSILKDFRSLSISHGAIDSNNVHLSFDGIIVRINGWKSLSNVHSDERFQHHTKETCSNILAPSTIKEIRSYHPVRSLVEQWGREEIDTYTYLIALNALAGRTLNGDPSAHPAFPWIINLSNQKNGGKSLHPINQRSIPGSPISSLSLSDSHERYQETRWEWRDLKLSKWREIRRDMQVDHAFKSMLSIKQNPSVALKSFYPQASPTILTSFPSSPSFTAFPQHPPESGPGSSFTQPLPHHISDILSDHSFLTYTARRQPINVLQRFVRAEFNPLEYPASISDLYDNTPEEAIPEFYSDPSVFVSQNPTLLKDLEVPKWCAGEKDPVEFFVKTHRDLLESPQISKTIHFWIDQTFGYLLSNPLAALKDKQIKGPLATSSVPRSGASGSGMVQLFDMPHPPRNVFGWKEKTIKHRLMDFDEDSSLKMGDSDVAMFLDSMRDRSASTLATPSSDETSTDSSSVSAPSPLHSTEKKDGKEEDGQEKGGKEEDSLEKMQADDIFAVGCLFVEALTGKRPFTMRREEMRKQEIKIIPFSDRIRKNENTSLSFTLNHSYEPLARTHQTHLHNLISTLRPFVPSPILEVIEATLNSDWTKRPTPATILKNTQLFPPHVSSVSLLIQRLTKARYDPRNKPDESMSSIITRVVLASSDLLLQTSVESRALLKPLFSAIFSTALHFSPDSLALLPLLLRFFGPSFIRKAIAPHLLTLTQVVSQSVTQLTMFEYLNPSISPSVNPSNLYKGFVSFLNHSFISTVSSVFGADLSVLFIPHILSTLKHTSGLVQTTLRERRTGVSPSKEDTSTLSSLHLHLANSIVTLSHTIPSPLFFKHTFPFFIDNIQNPAIASIFLYISTEMGPHFIYTHILPLIMSLLNSHLSRLRMMIMLKSRRTDHRAQTVVEGDVGAQTPQQSIAQQIQRASFSSTGAGTTQHVQASPGQTENPLSKESEELAVEALHVLLQLFISFLRRCPNFACNTIIFTKQIISLIEASEVNETLNQTAQHTTQLVRDAMIDGSAEESSTLGLLPLENTPKAQPKPARQQTTQPLVPTRLKNRHSIKRLESGQTEREKEKLPSGRDRFRHWLGQGREFFAASDSETDTSDDSETKSESESGHFQPLTSGKHLTIDVKAKAISPRPPVSPPFNAPRATTPVDTNLLFSTDPLKAQRIYFPDSSPDDQGDNSDDSSDDIPLPVPASSKPDVDVPKEVLEKQPSSGDGGQAAINEQMLLARQSMQFVSEGRKDTSGEALSPVIAAPTPLKAQSPFVVKNTTVVPPSPIVTSNWHVPKSLVKMKSDANIPPFIQYLLDPSLFISEATFKSQLGQRVLFKSLELLCLLMDSASSAPPASSAQNPQTLLITQNLLLIEAFLNLICTSLFTSFYTTLPITPQLARLLNRLAHQLCLPDWIKLFEHKTDQLVKERPTSARSTWTHHLLDIPIDAFDENMELILLTSAFPSFSYHVMVQLEKKGGSKFEHPFTHLYHIISPPKQTIKEVPQMSSKLPQRSPDVARLAIELEADQVNGSPNGQQQSSALVIDELVLVNGLLQTSLHSILHQAQRTQQSQTPDPSGSPPSLNEPNHVKYRTLQRTRQPQPFLDDFISRLVRARTYQYQPLQSPTNSYDNLTIPLHEPTPSPPPSNDSAIQQIEKSPEASPVSSPVLKQQSVIKATHIKRDDGEVSGFKVSDAIKESVGSKNVKEAPVPPSPQIQKSELQRDNSIWATKISHASNPSPPHFFTTPSKLAMASPSSEETHRKRSKMRKRSDRNDSDENHTSDTQEESTDDDYSTSGSSEETDEFIHEGVSWHKEKRRRPRKADERGLDVANQAITALGGGEVRKEEVSRPIQPLTHSSAMSLPRHCLDTLKAVDSFLYQESFVNPESVSISPMNTPRSFAQLDSASSEPDSERSSMVNSPAPRMRPNQPVDLNPLETAFRTNEVTLTSFRKSSPFFFHTFTFADKFPSFRNRCLIHIHGGTLEEANPSTKIARATQHWTRAGPVSPGDSPDSKKVEVESLSVASSQVNRPRQMKGSHRIYSGTKAPVSSLLASPNEMVIVAGSDKVTVYNLGELHVEPHIVYPLHAFTATMPVSDIQWMIGGVHPPASEVFDDETEDDSPPVEKKIYQSKQNIHQSLPVPWFVKRKEELHKASEGIGKTKKKQPTSAPSSFSSRVWIASCAGDVHIWDLNSQKTIWSDESRFRITKQDIPSSSSAHQIPHAGASSVSLSSFHEHIYFSSNFNVSPQHKHQQSSVSRSNISPVVQFGSSCGRDGSVRLIDIRQKGFVSEWQLYCDVEETVSAVQRGSYASLSSPFDSSLTDMSEGSYASFIPKPLYTQAPAITTIDSSGRLVTNPQSQAFQTFAQYSTQHQTSSDRAKAPSSPEGLRSRGVTCLSYGSLVEENPLLSMLLYHNNFNSNERFRNSTNLFNRLGSAASQLTTLPNWISSANTHSNSIGCGCADGTISVLDMRTGTSFWNWQTRPQDQNTNEPQMYPTRLFHSPAGVVCVMSDGKVESWKPPPHGFSSLSPRPHNVIEFLMDDMTKAVKAASDDVTSLIRSLGAKPVEQNKEELLDYQLVTLTNTALRQVLSVQSPQPDPHQPFASALSCVKPLATLLNASHTAAHSDGAFIISQPKPIFSTKFGTKVSFYPGQLNQPPEPSPLSVPDRDILVTPPPLINRLHPETQIEQAPPLTTTSTLTLSLLPHREFKPTNDSPFPQLSKTETVTKTESSSSAQQTGQSLSIATTFLHNSWGLGGQRSFPHSSTVQSVNPSALLSQYPLSYTPNSSQTIHLPQPSQLHTSLSMILCSRNMIGITSIPIPSITSTTQLEHLIDLYALLTRFVQEVQELVDDMSSQRSDPLLGDDIPRYERIGSSEIVIQKEKEILQELDILLTQLAVSIFDNSQELSQLIARLAAFVKEGADTGSSSSLQQNTAILTRQHYFSSLLAQLRHILSLISSVGFPSLQNAAGPISDSSKSSDTIQTTPTLSLRASMKDIAGTTPYDSLTTITTLPGTGIIVTGWKDGGIRLLW